MKFRALFVLLAFLCLFAGLKIKQSDYLREQEVWTTVLSKGEEACGKYGRSSCTWLVLKRDSDGTIFDLRVSHSTHYLAKEGHQLVFNLRELDIKQDLNKNWTHLTAMVLFMSLATVLIPFSIGYFTYGLIERKNK